jgi:hypothetical protein
VLDILAVSRFDSPIEQAYRQAVNNGLQSIVYSALNGGVPAKARKKFREYWLGQGPVYLIQRLARYAAQDWGADPDEFWVNPWFAEYLRPETDGIYRCLYQWLGGIPLPPMSATTLMRKTRRLKN